MTFTPGFFITVVGNHLAAGGCPRVEFWGKILSFFPIFWVFWQRFEFFPLCSLNKSCPNFEFWAKNGLEFFQRGRKLSFFSPLSFRENVEKKKPGLIPLASSASVLIWARESRNKNERRLKLTNIFLQPWRNLGENSLSDRVGRIGTEPHHRRVGLQKPPRPLQNPFLAGVQDGAKIQWETLRSHASTSQKEEACRTKVK